MPYAGDFVGFLILGGLSIIAAITYTWAIVLMVISVWVIFPYWFSWLVKRHGELVFTGSYIDSGTILPATACGLLATAVLNINNRVISIATAKTAKTRWWCA